MLRRIRYKIGLVLAGSVSLVFAGIAGFYSVKQEQYILEQNRIAMERLSDTVALGVRSVMLTERHEFATDFAGRLKRVDQIIGLNILKQNGEEAFHDNDTLHRINRNRRQNHEPLFKERENPVRVAVLDGNDPNLLSVIGNKQRISYYTSDLRGERSLTILTPILTDEKCWDCHSADVAGAVMLTTSLDGVETEIRKTREYVLTLLLVGTVGIILVTGFMVGRTVIRPIEQVTRAMRRAANGNLKQTVPVVTDDEIGHMAESFNAMTKMLAATYDGLKVEQDKLATIIRSAGEGIAVTDRHSTVVLVNPAAERLLGKSAGQITREGFLNLLDDPGAMRRRLEDTDHQHPDVVAYRNHVLQIYASTINNDNGEMIGSAALLRDITEEKRLEEELQRLAVTDPLTGLFNRRYLDHRILEEIERAQRYNLNFAVIMADVDHFKRFNDSFGHDAGDKALRKVARTLREALRTPDVPCRYGGEEFLLILPNTDRAGAASVAERIRKDIETLELQGSRITVSLGVAGFRECGTQTAHDLIGRADKALYVAKSTGRNRVCLAE